MNQRFLINRGDAKVMGVAAGLADYTGVDPDHRPPGLRRPDAADRPGDDPLLRSRGAAGAAPIGASRSFPLPASQHHDAGVDDPYNLQRFVDAQHGVYRSCARRTSRRIEAEPLDVVHLSAARRPRPQPDRPILRHRLARRGRAPISSIRCSARACANAWRRCCRGQAARTAEQILGPVDAMKLRSSLTLFDEVRAGRPFRRRAGRASSVAQRDERTLALLNRQA